MNRQTKRWLRAFPRSWRSRYGTEFETLIEKLESADDLRTSDRVDVIRSGLEMRRAQASALGRPAWLFATAGIVVAALCVVGGLALSGTFSSPPTSTLASPRIISVIRIHPSESITVPARPLTFWVTQIPKGSRGTTVIVLPPKSVHVPTEKLIFAAGSRR